ncbi:HK97 family phage portal protein [Sinorhizobium meliloti]|uniref:phage portal protein n=2 Tax=Rhizobium meliloti TaxID=382 RepID=UPI000FDAAD94|nr:phage portal protein [Sinorhizobium meliloti]MBP2465891.1 HK97 family phage portal protein [Sinorhizobium meliloti]MBP2466564.1 HK97 family phage portal protein [Sinorhizobium meliloti]MQW79340.1 phage portal protein [Sinorhizobium meliloti]MQW79353.1 phage portal protein [Sinorhizobium meliloti]MQW79367.1 phage portal protein [Sinorhizobium meliloti]
MSLLRKMATFFRRLSLRTPDGWYPDGQRSDAGEPITDQNILAISAVWACVNLLAGTIASLPLMVYRTNSRGERTLARDHPLFRILHDSPNYDQTATDFWEYSSASIELWGNSYAAIERNGGGRVAALTPLRPDSVSVRRLENGNLEYRWTMDGENHVGSDRAILHIRGFGGDPLGGMSTLHFGRHAFGLARAIDRAAAGTFSNGMISQTALTFERWLTDEQRNLAETKLSEKYIGAKNSGRPIILEGGTKIDVLSIKPEDAQMLESRGFSVEEVCRFFGVPPFMVGHTQKVTSFGSGLEQQVLGFQKFTLRRRLKRIEQALEKQLLTPAERAAGLTIEFNLEGLLRGDSTARAAFYQSVLANGWMTINEVREKENLPRVEGGDVPRMQMQNVPITEAGKQQEALPAPAENQEPEP